jgi:hypothetical protein
MSIGHNQKMNTDLHIPLGFNSFGCSGGGGGNSLLLQRHSLSLSFSCSCYEVAGFLLPTGKRTIDSDYRHDAECKTRAQYQPS